MARSKHRQNFLLDLPVVSAGYGFETLLFAGRIDEALELFWRLFVRNLLIVLVGTFAGSFCRIWLRNFPFASRIDRVLELFWHLFLRNLLIVLFGNFYRIQFVLNVDLSNEFYLSFVDLSKMLINRPC